MDEEKNLNNSQSNPRLSTHVDHIHMAVAGIPSFLTFSRCFHGESNGQDSKLRTRTSVTLVALLTRLVLFLYLLHSKPGKANWSRARYTSLASLDSKAPQGQRDKGERRGHARHCVWPPRYFPAYSHSVG